jgi:hypothetical protein
MKSIENLRQLFFNAYANASFDPLQAIIDAKRITGV